MKHLLDAGFAGRLLLSQDRSCLTRGKPFHPLPEKILPKVDALKRAGEWPAPQTYLFTHFLPMLRQRGIGQAAIDSILDENPRRFFAGDKFAA